MQTHTLLDEKVDHLQKDVTEVKSEVKRLNAEFVEHRLQTELAFSAVRTELKDSIASVRVELKDSIASVRAELKDSIASVRAELKDSIATVRIELKGEIAALRNDMTAQIGALRVEMRDAIDQLRQTRFSQMAWFVGTVIASIGAACAVVKLLLVPSADR
jgi:hypothetical protein